jgi:hypothetical protein
MNQLSKLQKQYLDEANKIFPGLIQSYSYSFWGGEQEQPQTASTEFDYSFLNDNAFGNNEIIHLIHYTSLEKAFEILNSGKIRLYNTYNFNDSAEIEYGLKQFNLSIDDETLDNYKRAYHSLSCCLYENSTSEDFNLWRFYGNGGHGLAFIFSIDKSKIRNWSNLFLGNISYHGLSPHSKKVYNFFQFHNNFQKTHKIFNNTPSFLITLASLYKNPIYKSEKELRIFTYVNTCKYTYTADHADIFENPIVSNSIKNTIGKNNTPATYLEIPLSIEDEPDDFQYISYKKQTENLKDYIPFLNIEKIILGPELGKKDIWYDIMQMIRVQQSRHLKYHFNVEHSSIRLD